MVTVKVFISSLIGGYQDYRAAAVEAIETLGHQVVKAEDFPASSGTPQQACLAAVRDCDVVVLLLGERYGYVQSSGLSATHEEYREARERKPVPVFVEDVSQREGAQQAFLDEVQAWSTGQFRASFTTPGDLKTVIVRALHEHELATSAGPVDESEMLDRAVAMLPDEQASSWGGRPLLSFAVAGGPYQQVLRPVDLEDQDLAVSVQHEAFFGEHPVLDRNASSTTSIRGNTLVLAQDSASVALDQAGWIQVAQPALTDTDAARQGLPAVIVEDLVDSLENAIRFSGWLLEHVDPERRLTDVVPVARITNTSYMAWRTRAEHAANPNAAATTPTGIDT